MTKTTRKNYLAARSLRIGAIVIDTLILGGIGLLIGLGFENQLIQLGPWGKLLGFIIALLYFGFGNSQIGKGQTIGKKLLGIQVVGTNGTTISLVRSFLRYTVLATPFFINGTNIASDSVQKFLIYPLSLILFGGILSILYLFIFNRATGQSLHDLAAKTYVINKGVDKHGIGQLRQAHLIVVAIIAVVSVLLPLFTNHAAKGEVFKELVVVKQAVAKQPDVTNVIVTQSTSTETNSATEKKVTKHLLTQVSLNTHIADHQKFAQRIASIAVANYADIGNIDSIGVTLVYGYDIGIAAKWQSYSYQFTPDELAASE